MSPAVTVILPAKNSAAFIGRCIDSVLSQTFTDWELLVVNDGSEDDTCKIAESFSAKDPRIRLFDSKGKGLSAARNLGIDMASGDHIAFIDADDSIDPQYLAVLEDLIIKEKADLSQCSLYYLYEDGTRIKEKETANAVYDGHNDIMKAYLSGMVGHICLAAWGKLFRKDLLADIRFDETLTVQEDAFFTFQCCMKASRAACCDEPLYYYYHNPASVMNRPFDGSKMQYFTVLDRELDICSDNEKLTCMINIRKLVTALDLTTNVICDGSGKEYLGKLRDIALQTRSMVGKNADIGSKTRKKVYLLKHFPSVYYGLLKTRAKCRQKK